MHGIYKGLSNGFVAFPTFAKSCFEYMTELKGLEKGTPEHRAKCQEIHTRVAERIKKMSMKCGGAYFKLG